MMNKPKNFTDYIKDFPPTTRQRLKQIRALVKQLAPEAEEGMSYGMPSFKLNGPLVYFAGFKKHIGVYATPSGNAAFQKELAGYKTGKGSIQFPLDQPLPLPLIKKIVQFKVKENVKK